ncbi:hypothetical protein [Rhodococcus sp. As11]|uniref:hypothetical protein n=1 Tax=Rhodococcus sp. As11 TaxID=3029189 RepID=UPI003B7950B9
MRSGSRGTAFLRLRWAYHIGSDDLFNQMFAEIQQLDCAPDLKLELLHHFAGWMHKYVDWMTRVVLDAHEEEQRVLVRQSENVTSALVEQVLSGGAFDTEEFATKTGYRLDGTHLGAIAWIEGPAQGADQTPTLAAAAETLTVAAGGGGSPLLVPVDRRTAWLWTTTAVARSSTCHASGPLCRPSPGCA